MAEDHCALQAYPAAKRASRGLQDPLDFLEHRKPQLSTVDLEGPQKPLEHHVTVATVT